MTRLPRPCVCLVTDRRLADPAARTTRDELAALERIIDEAMAAGIDLIQIRERDLDAAVLIQLVRNIIQRASGIATRVLVNDRTDVARAADAHGVHLRADSAPVARVRDVVPPDWIVGRSAHTPAEVRASASADYILFGAVFRPVSKPSSLPPAGLDGLRAAVGSVRVPVLAIGGIDPERAALSANAGAAGVAAISLFFSGGAAGSIAGTIAALRKAFETRADFARRGRDSGPRVAGD